MITNDSAAATLRQFVLGALADQDRLVIEERLITDPATFAALQLVEGALAEAYVDGELSPADRQRFERHYLTTTERCRQVTVLRLVRDRARTGFRVAPPGAPIVPIKPSPRQAASRMPPAWTLALAASLCLAVGWSARLMVQQASLAREFAALTRQRSDQQRTVSQMTDELARLSARAVELEGRAVRPRAAVADQRSGRVGPSDVVAPEYQLRAGVLRGADTLGPVAVPPGAAVVRLRLPLPDPAFPTYRAAVFDEDGAERWSVSRLVPDTTTGAHTLHVVAPSELLPPGEYEVRV
ncbi:MAG: zf-HC2 domain-containing protein, partial [Vicinamibacterales bacterium]